MSARGRDCNSHSADSGLDFLQVLMRMQCDAVPDFLHGQDRAVRRRSTLREWVAPRASDQLPAQRVCAPEESMEHVSCAIHAQDLVAIRECRAAVCALVGYAALRFRLRASDAHGNWSLVSRYLVRTTPPTRLSTAACCGLGFGLHPSPLVGRAFLSCFGRLSVSTELNSTDLRAARQGCSRSCISSLARQGRTESLARILDLPFACSSPNFALDAHSGHQQSIKCPPNYPFEAAQIRHRVPLGAPVSCRWLITLMAARCTCRSCRRSPTCPSASRQA